MSATTMNPEETTPPPARRRPVARYGLGRLIWRVSQHRRGSFWRGYAAFGVFFLVPVLTGWLVGRGYHALSLGRTTTVIWFAIAVAVSETVRMAALYWGLMHWVRAIVHMESFLRANMLQAQLISGGELAGNPAGSASEAIPHFRDDVDDVVQLIDGCLDVSYSVVLVGSMGLILGGMNAGAAAALIVPLVAVGVGARLLDTRIKRYRAQDREAASAVTGLVGDMMAAATTVKVNDAIVPVTDRLAALAEARRHTAVRDRVLDEGVQAFSRGMTDVAFGLALLVAAGALADGRFGVAEMAVYVSYLGWLSFVPRIIGRVLARRKQATIAVERMSRLVADNDATNLVLDQHLPIDVHEVQPRLSAVRPPRVPLERMDVVNFTTVFPTGAGVRDVTFSVERGSFTVITGPIGSGKTTLLRGLLGLLPQLDQHGEVRWNGVALLDRAAFLVPPNASFLPQVPQLISDSLADNIALGASTDEALHHALTLAELEHDIAAMHDGIATMIGPRGLRLSGGQRQRVATARALVHGPELVVVDDVSSALDVETEIRLWDNLANAGMTVLAVSHRAVAFERATQILRLDAGRLTGR